MFTQGLSRLHIPHIQPISSVVFAHKRQVFAIRGHTETGLDGVKRFEVGTSFTLDDDLDLARAIDASLGDAGVSLHIAEEDERIRRIGKIDVWHERRLEIVPRFCESLGHATRRIGGLNIRQIPLAKLVAPVFIEIAQLLARGDGEDFGEGLGPPPVVEKTSENVGSISSSHVVADRLAFLVHLERTVDRCHA